MTRIAVIGMACRLPDASSPRELWENALAGRRAFRRLPDSRLNLRDYWSRDRMAPDRTYGRHAALIEGYHFDRATYAVAGSTYRSTDLTHWLALDTAGQALGDAGFPAAEGLIRERTGVIVGNTLTGEFSRAGLMRLRWPYVRRTVGAALAAEGWSGERLADFLGSLETSYKAPFPEVDEDSLAGGLANTIAGRICNHFDLGGGGYTVDGACSSSLLSVLTACRSLTAGELDVAVAGGVDLSIDPFEMVGFAKTGALATDEMRIYDRRSNGFWPGEGCGMVVLMREPDARAAGLSVQAVISGWGVSSDGRGGITRPEIGGYRRMLRRAYDAAGFGIESVGLFEGHGTGTVVGDRTELTALGQSRVEAGAYRPAAIGSVKGMIGHTKAAAGVAGLIKTVMALREQVLPPTLGCVEPHELLATPDAPLRALPEPEPWESATALRAGVTAMGFGGINTHVVLEAGSGSRRARLGRRSRDLAASAQDAELLLLDGEDPARLRTRVAELADRVGRLSWADLADLAAACQRDLRDRPWRAAVVVTSPADAESRLRRVLAALDRGEQKLHAQGGRIAMGHATGRPRIGYLFPGQGSGGSLRPGAVGRRFPVAADVFAATALPPGADPVATENAQPGIVAGALAGLRVLSAFGLEADAAVGHSLGEICALHWAGVLDAEVALRLARERGQLMALRAGAGGMAALTATTDAAESLLGDLPVVVAGENGPRETVVAGPLPALDVLTRRCAQASVACTRLRVSHPFHSPLMSPAATELAVILDREQFDPPERDVVSTVTGAVLTQDVDVRALLTRQVIAPVRFAPALAALAHRSDLLVEVGPGRVLTGLAARLTDVPVVASDIGGDSLAGLWAVIGVAWTAGAPVWHHEAFRRRVVKPFSLQQPQSFFANPCELAPDDVASEAGQLSGTAAAPVREDLPVDRESRGAPDVEQDRAPDRSPVGSGDGATTSGPGRPGAAVGSVDTLRGLFAERVELPAAVVRDDSRVLDDLHLSSITVAQVVTQAARRLGRSLAQPPTNLATATLREIAELLDAAEPLDETRAREAGREGEPVAGAAAWVRAFAVDLEPVPLPPAGEDEPAGGWRLHEDVPSGLGGRLKLALEQAPIGAGVLVHLQDGEPEAGIAAALAGAHELMAGEHGERFVLVERGESGIAALARTLRQESAGARVTIVHLPADAPVAGVDPGVAVAAVVAEVAATTGFSEVHHDLAGGRRVPTLRALPARARREDPPLGNDDVLLVTGGGKGITAECALALALDGGCRLALLGRSDPGTDRELSGNLARMRAAGVAVHYVRADVTDRRQVRKAVAELGQRLGPVTAVVHGAGGNDPTALADLTLDGFERSIAPKIAGLEAVLDAVDTGRLKLLVTFGSIIGRAGLRGEAHYATANAWLARVTEEVARRLPRCRARCLEWSVWSGVGMGERLSVVESLAREGVSAVSAEEGLRLLRRLVTDPDAPTTVVVSGRTGEVDTVRHQPMTVPLRRFLGRPLVQYAGIELVTEVELNIGSDPYLADHCLDGDLIFPAVLGLEAMAQVGSAALGCAEIPVIEDARFLQPVVIPADGSLTLRLAATATDDDTVTVAIRCATTGFGEDHFRARLRFAGSSPSEGPPDQMVEGLGPVPLDPAADLYGSLLFQSGRFRRLTQFHRVSAYQVDAESLAEDAAWFAPFLPAELLLGDPGVRDSVMHGNQVCVPDATLLPVRIERLHPGGDKLAAAGRLRFSASERSRSGDVYVYDIAVRTAGGEVVERWEGLHLRATLKRASAGPWSPALLGPYLERSVADQTGVRIRVVVEPFAGPAGPVQRRRSTALAAGRAVGHPVTVDYRPDGRPELSGTSGAGTGTSGSGTISATHGSALTVVVLSSGRSACDVETVLDRRPEDRDALLGRGVALASLIAARMHEDLEVAATRVWTAHECLRKVGQAQDAPLVVDGLPGQPASAAGAWPGWVFLRSGPFRIGTFVTTVSARAQPVVFAILVQGEADDQAL